MIAHTNGSDRKILSLSFRFLSLFSYFIWSLMEVWMRVPITFFFFLFGCCVVIIPTSFSGWNFYFFFVCVDEGSARAAMVHLVRMGSLFQDMRRWSHLPDPPLHGHGQRLRNPRAKHPLPNLQHAGKINSNKNQMDLKYANFIFFGGENFRL